MIGAQSGRRRSRHQLSGSGFGTAAPDHQPFAQDDQHDQHGDNPTSVRTPPEWFRFGAK
jgi:hypothetical protein